MEALCLFRTDLGSKWLLIGEPTTLTTNTLTWLRLEFRRKTLGSHLPAIPSARRARYIIARPIVMHCCTPQSPV